MDKKLETISLANVDVKIGSKAIAKRLETVLPHIIHYDQNAFVKGRTLFDAARTISDVMEFTKMRDYQGIMAAIDFEKAFDSLNWNFLLKSGNPEISPGGVQNEKIEDPWTLPESGSGRTISRKNTLSPIRFLFYAKGGKIGFVALTSASRGPDNPLFERRLKINKTVNVTIDYLNEKNTYLRTDWNSICLILSRTKFLGDFCFFPISHSFCRTNKWQNWKGKIAPWYMAWGYIKLIQRKNKASSSNNCSKIFGQLKLQNFRTPNKSDTKVKTRHPLSRICRWKISNAPAEKRVGRFRRKKSLLCRKKATFYQC